MPVATIPANGCTTSDAWPRSLLPVVPRRSLKVPPYTAAGACTPACHRSTRPLARFLFPRGGRGTELYHNEDDITLYNLPEFYEQMHELEKEKASHDPAAHVALDGTEVTEVDTTSTRKQSRPSNVLLEEYIEGQKNGMRIW